MVAEQDNTAKRVIIRPDVQGRFALTPNFETKSFKAQVMFTNHTAGGSKTYQFGVLIPFETVISLEDATEFVFDRAHHETDDSSQLKSCPTCLRKIE